MSHRSHSSSIFLIAAASLILFAAVLGGCTGRMREDSYRDHRRGAPADATLAPSRVSTPIRPVVKSRAALPWETWQPQRDLDGRMLTNIIILEGDRFFENDELERALQLYLQAARQNLTEQEEKALALRLAGTQLALDRPAEALATVSSHFRSAGQGADQVDPNFSLILGYAYGRNRDYEQSLAWFSRTHRITGGQGPVAESAWRGVRLLLNSMPEAEFLQLSHLWKSDSFVAELMGRERAARAQRDYGSWQREPDRAFWRDEQEQVQSLVRSSAQTMAVLLPLSGSYAALGRSVKEGIELALSAPSAQGVTAAYHDTRGEAGQAATAAREVVMRREGVGILGPLLTEAVLLAAEQVRGSNVPMITFSKSDDLVTGRGVFRVGPTTRSQVNSLLDFCVRQLSLRRYAIVFPENAVGQNFAREFRRRAGELGVEVVYQASYFDGDQGGFANIANEIESSTAEAVFVPDDILNAARFSTNLSERTRQRLRLLGTAGWDASRKLAHSKAAMEGATFPSLFFVESERPAIRQFIEAYRQRFNGDPDFLAAQGFDAATIFIAALSRQLAQGIGFSSAIEQIGAYEGLTGTINILPSGELQGLYTVVEYRNGSLRDAIQGIERNFILRGGAVAEEQPSPELPGEERKERPAYY